MNLAKISANGQIVVDNASATAIIKAQKAFAGAAEAKAKQTCRSWSTSFGMTWTTASENHARYQHPHFRSVA